MTGSDAERSRSESAAWDQFEAWRLFGGNKRLDFNWRQRALLTLASWCFRSYQRFVTDSLSWNLHDPYGVDDAIRRKKQNFILAVWHNRLIGAISFFDRFHVRVQYSSRIGPLVSESFDGELIARSIRDVNGENVRGSSSRNAVAGLRHAVAELRSGLNLCVTGDGPRGPRYRLKPGVIMAGKLSGIPIVPLVWSCTRALQMRRSWDQALIPLRYSTLNVYFGEPLWVGAEADANAIAIARREVELRMRKLTEQADLDTRIAWQIPAPRAHELTKLRKLPSVAMEKRL